MNPLSPPALLITVTYSASTPQRRPPGDRVTEGTEWNLMAQFFLILQSRAHRLAPGGTQQGALDSKAHQNTEINHRMHFTSTIGRN